jgi:hypothetical protein
MTLDLTSFFQTKKQSVKVKILRDQQLKVDGTLRHVSEGEIVEVTKDSLSQIDRSDYQVISNNSKPVEIIDPTPARPVVKPAPEKYSKLPKCFAKYHELNEQLRVAREHINLIHAERKRQFGVDGDFAGATGTHLIGAFTGSQSEGTNTTSTLQAYNFSDPELRKVAQYLSDSLKDAEEHLISLSEKSILPLQRAFYESGNLRIKAASDLLPIIEEIEAIGFEIFSTRVSALGLGIGHTQKLYNGSSDFQKYARLEQPSFNDVCFGGMDNDGTMRTYSEMPVDQAAYHFIKDTARLPELKALLAEAKKELAKTKQAAA